MTSDQPVLHPVTLHPVAPCINTIAPNQLHLCSRNLHVPIAASSCVQGSGHRWQANHLNSILQGLRRSEIFCTLLAVVRCRISATTRQLLVLPARWRGTSCRAVPPHMRARAHTTTTTTTTVQARARAHVRCSFEQLVASADKWTTHTSAPSTRFSHALVAVSSKLYILGMKFSPVPPYIEADWAPYYDKMVLLEHYNPTTGIALMQLHAERPCSCSGFECDRKWGHASSFSNLCLQIRGQQATNHRHDKRILGSQQSVAKYIVQLACMCTRSSIIQLQV